jgi:hypothetical protein
VRFAVLLQRDCSFDVSEPSHSGRSNGLIDPAYPPPCYMATGFCMLDFTLNRVQPWTRAVVATNNALAATLGLPSWKRLILKENSLTFHRFGAGARQSALQVRTNEKIA